MSEQKETLEQWFAKHEMAERQGVEVNWKSVAWRLIDVLRRIPAPAPKGESKQAHHPCETPGCGNWVEEQNTCCRECLVDQMANDTSGKNN